MTSPTTVILLGTGAGVATAAASMMLHLFGRLWRSSEDRQRELDAQILGLLQAGGLPEDVLIRLQRRPQARVRRSLVRALAALGDTYGPYVNSVYERLELFGHALRDLASRNWARRAEAALEAGLLRRPEAAQELVRLLHDPRYEVTLAAARALCDLRIPHTIRMVLERIPACTRWSISSWVEMLRGFGPEAFDELIATLGQTTSRTTRLAAIEALGVIGSPQAIPYLHELFQTSEMDQRIVVARALAQISAEESLPTLRTAIQDNSWEVRAIAARALGACTSPDTVALLEKALTDASWWVRLNASEALARHEYRGVEALRTAVAGPDSFARDIAAQMLQKLSAESAS